MALWAGAGQAGDPLRAVTLDALRGPQMRWMSVIDGDDRLAGRVVPVGLGDHDGHASPVTTVLDGHVGDAAGGGEPIADEDRSVVGERLPAVEDHPASRHELGDDVTEGMLGGGAVGLQLRPRSLVGHDEREGRWCRDGVEAGCRRGARACAASSCSSRRWPSCAGPRGSARSMAHRRLPWRTARGWLSSAATVLLGADHAFG